MEYQQFIETIKTFISDQLGDGYEIKVQRVVKNNNYQLDGLTIRKEGEQVSPNIYLNDFYMEYQRGTKIKIILEKMMAQYEASMDHKTDCEQIAFTWEAVKDKIIFRVVSYLRNRTMLKNIPYFRFLDLAITFHCLVQCEQEGIGTVQITKEYMRQWNIHAKDLMKLAMENTQRIFPPSCRMMSEVIEELMNKTKEEWLFHITVREKEEIPMYVLSNCKGMNGASVILYPDLMKQIADKTESDIYILPSSIHEVILIPYTKELKREWLKEMVFDINRTQVPTDEVLSNEVYLYKRNENSFDL